MTRKTGYFTTMSVRKPAEPHPLCGGCVYYPPNLPQGAYAAADWALLQALACSFDYRVDSPECRAVRKTSCALVPEIDPQRPVADGT